MRSADCSSCCVGGLEDDEEGMIMIDSQIRFNPILTQSGNSRLLLRLGRHSQGHVQDILLSASTIILKTFDGVLSDFSAEVMDQHRTLKFLEQLVTAANNFIVTVTLSARLFTDPRVRNDII